MQTTNKHPDKIYDRLRHIGGAPDETLLTPREVSALSGFEEVTLRLWHRQGRGPARTFVEGRPRYRLGDVRAWMRGESADTAA